MENEDFTQLVNLVAALAAINDPRAQVIEQLSHSLKSSVLEASVTFMDNCSTVTLALPYPTQPNATQLVRAFNKVKGQSLVKANQQSFYSDCWQFTHTVYHDGN